MEQKTIDRTLLLNEFSKKLSLQVDKLKQDPHSYSCYKKIHTLIVKTLIKYSWEPEFDEKAMMFDLVGKQAWHLWRTDTRIPSEYRFREVPNGFYMIFYYRQEIVPTYSRKIYNIALPLTIFKEIKKVMRVKILPYMHK